MWDFSSFTHLSMKNTKSFDTVWKPDSTRVLAAALARNFAGFYIGYLCDRLNDKL